MKSKFVYQVWFKYPYGACAPLVGATVFATRELAQQLIDRVTYASGTKDYWIVQLKVHS